jgi:nicotinate phosphoribosyltransferase
MIEKEISNLCSLRFTEGELEYLRKIYFLTPDYIDFLRFFQLQERYIFPQFSNGLLDLKIEGPWLHTILFETAVLAIINEVYFKTAKPPILNEQMEGSKKLERKIRLIKENKEYNGYYFKFADFGARRRFNYSWHYDVVKRLKDTLPNNFIGTSDVHLAREFGITPIGTMAHEWIQAGQALTRLKESQKFMLQKWANEFRGSLGIALSDTLGIDAFLRDFDSYFAKLFDGVRHDSGSPILCASKVIDHYNKLKIDPRTKTIVFSDNLTIEKAERLRQICSDQIKVSFGIGTNLTNDLIRPPLNIVIKMTQCEGQPVAKISDNNGKGMCEDAGYLRYLKSVFKIGE